MRSRVLRLLKPGVIYDWRVQRNPLVRKLQYRELSTSDITTSTDFDITFLGTSSAMPTISRSTSCVAMRYWGDVWLFDAGEGAQRQFLMSPCRPANVRKIFITHLHGDHVFGLPGLLCSLGLAQVRQPKDSGVDIYGPEGLREFIYTSIMLTFSTVIPRIRVHELKNIPFEGRPTKRSNRAPFSVSLAGCSFLKQIDIDQSRDIYPDALGVYHIISPDSDSTDSIDGGQDISKSAYLSVRAAPMKHSIPCVGYVVQEADKRGTLHPERVADVIERNKQRIQDHFKISDNQHVYKLLKNLLPGEELIFPDGTAVRAEDVVGPTRKGRKVVIMGDTCSGEYIKEIATGADLLIHEATNAWTSDDAEMKEKYGTPMLLQREVVSRGHSTPDMAGAFAAQTRAKHLVMTHFSAKFGGGEHHEERRIMHIFERLAQRAAAEAARKNPRDIVEPTEITAARDYMTINIAMPSRSLGRD